MAGGCETLEEFCLRRVESVRRQLAGELATRTVEQLPEDKMDASDISIADMGVAAL